MTTSEINQQVKIIFDQYYKSLDGYSDEKFNLKPDENTWSLAEMYEHVCLTGKKFFLANTKRCLEKRGGEEGGTLNKSGESVFKHGGFPPTMKFKVPEALETFKLEPKYKDHYKTEISEILDSADKFMEAVENDEGTYKTQHPVLGMLNAKEWYHNLEMHRGII